MNKIQAMRYYSIISIVLVFTVYSSYSQTNNASPQFKNGESQVIEAFSKSKLWIKHELWVETEFDSDSDGKPDRMHVWVTRPPQTETNGLKLPVIYVSSPYFAGFGSNNKKYFWDVAHELGELPEMHEHPEVKRKEKRSIMCYFHDKTWVPRGYIMVYSSSPGTGFSQGVPSIGGENESLAPKAVIEWLCGKNNGYTSLNGNEQTSADWCTGKVGMTGTSYNGTLALAAATTGVDGLEAIIPIAPVSSYYLYYRSNGLVRSPGGYIGEDMDVLYDFINSGEPSMRPTNNKNMRDNVLIPGMERKTGDYSDFWAARDYLPKMKNMKAALLMSHGFNDWNVMPEHSYRVYAEAKNLGIPCQIYYHQKGHGGPPPMTIMNRWFTYYLHGIDNGVEKDSKAWIVREHVSRFQPTDYIDFPNPRAKMLSFFLHSATSNYGLLKTVKNSNNEQVSFLDDYRIKGAKLAKAKSSNNRLLFTTSILKKPVHLSGTPEITLKISSNKKAANLSVWLVSLPWNSGPGTKITDNIITRGWADPKNHSSITNEEALIPGKFYDVKFKLNPDDQIIQAGQQIGLMIFSSDNEFTLHPEPGTEITIDLKETILNLPVVGGIETFENAIK